MLSKQLPINKININEFSPNEMSPDQYNKLRKLIKRTGQYPSLVVAKIADRYLLLDGHNRLAIIKELDHKKAWCEIWKLSKREGNLFLATVNRLRGTDDVQKRVKLINEVYQSFGENRNLLLSFLPESERSLNALLKMSEKDYKDIDEELEDERNVIESQLADAFPEEEAKRMASVYKYEDDKMRLVFLFENRDDHEKAIKYFGMKPDSTKLLELIKKNGI